MNEKINALEETEQERANFSQVESAGNKPAAQGVNGKVNLCYKVTKILLKEFSK